MSQLSAIYGHADDNLYEPVYFGDFSINRRLDKETRAPVGALILPDAYLYNVHGQPLMPFRPCLDLYDGDFLQLTHRMYLQELIAVIQKQHVENAANWRDLKVEHPGQAWVAWSATYVVVSGGTYFIEENNPPWIEGMQKISREEVVNVFRLRS